MTKLLFTDNVGFRMSDWSTQRLQKVFAGYNCVMAITEDGRVLQKTVSPEYAARTEYWTRIREIAISRFFEGLAIGLVSDGTCLVAKRPLRVLTDRRSFDGALPFDVVNDEIRSWRGIVQVAASDAFFALDGEGRVHYAPLNRFSVSDYRQVLGWRDVRRIVTGNQNSVFGITRDGRLLAAGAGLTQGPHGDGLSRVLEGIRNAADVFPTGSECEDVILAERDGTVRSLFSPEDPASCLRSDGTEDQKLLDGTFWHTVYALSPERTLYRFQDPDRASLFAKKLRIRSFAVGENAAREPFVIALAE